MTRFYAGIAALAFVAACGDGNPFDETTDGTDIAQGRLYATELNGELTMNALVYNDNGTADPSDDTLIINNLPFDNTDISGGGYTRTGALPTGFERFESPTSGSIGDRQYFAVFRRSNFAQTAAVATGDYVDFGFGGATAQRIGAGGVPPERPASYIFTGEYAGIRISTETGGVGDVEYVTGDAELYVDILDFDTVGAVEGIIDNRVLYDVNGNTLGTLNDYLSLATADVDFANATTNSGEAFGLDGTTRLTNGNWQGVFAGPNGEEIAGIVVLEGQESGTNADRVRETGSFIVVNGG